MKSSLENVVGEVLVSYATAPGGFVALRFENGDNLVLRALDDGESPANQPQFVALRRVVMQGDKRICEATSSTLARRIANALNRYTPSRKGY